MLAAARRPILRHAHHAPGRRSLWLHSLTEGFLDLALVLPSSSVLPPYTSAIILVTLVGRLTSTIPIALWVRRRQWRADHVVGPALKAEVPAIKDAVHAEMQRMGVRGTREDLTMAFNKRANQIARKRLKELTIKHRCTTKPTMIIGPLAQIPSFIALSLFFSHISSIADTPLGMEQFLTLPSLTHTDPTLALPIALGFVTMGNVSTSHWFKTPEQLNQSLKVETEKGSMNFLSTKVVNASLSVLAVLRILIAATVPGAVVITWLTSSTLAMLQSWTFDWLKLRGTQKARRELEAIPAPQPTSSQRILATLPLSAKKDAPKPRRIQRGKN